jgi:DNA modification methylase
MERRGLQRLEWRDPEELKDNPRNWRRHPGAQILALKSVKAEVGWAGAVLFNERTGHLVDGHARKKIARKGEKIPVLIGSWTEEEEAKILATFDSIGMMAEADRDALERLLASVRFESPALGPLLENLIGEVGWQSIGVVEDLKEPADQLDRADELQRKWKTAKGQLWQAGDQLLFCGDSTDEALISDLFIGIDQRVNLVVCDPPYGVNYGSKTEWMEKRGAQRRRASIKNDDLKPEEIRKLFGDSLKSVVKHAAPGAVIYATVPSGTLLPYFIMGLEDGGFGFKHSLVWLKNALVMGRGDYHYRHETILYGWLENGPHYFIADRTQDSVFEIDRPHASPFHATTKPIALVARMITNSSRKGELVYDCFCGSGTTLLACQQLGRAGLGVEIDPRYVAVTLERMSALGSKPRLIEGRV